MKLFRHQDGSLIVIPEVGAEGYTVPADMADQFIEVMTREARSDVMTDVAAVKVMHARLVALRDERKSLAEDVLDPDGTRLERIAEVEAELFPLAESLGLLIAAMDAAYGPTWKEY